MPVFSAIHKRKVARRQAEAEAAAEKAALGPGPAFPTGALQNESYAQAAGMVARSEYARRRARPVNAITAAPALGAQRAIKRAPGVY